MLVVSLALVAVLLAGGSDDDDDTQAAGPTATRETIVATATPPPPSVTPEPTAVPALSFELQQRLNALPEKLRNETLSAYSQGTLTAEQLEQITSDFENRNPSVRVGSVLGVTGDRLRFEVFTTGEQVEVETIGQTLVRRGEAGITLADLMLDELVMVVSTDEGATALTIDAFGVVAP